MNTVTGTKQQRENEVARDETIAREKNDAKREDWDKDSHRNEANHPNEQKQEDREAQNKEPRFVPMRARFVCTEVTATHRGVTILGMEQKYDANIRPEEQLVSGAAGRNPVGKCTIEVSNDYAGKNDAHGSVFYLISTNQKHQ